MPVPDSEAAQGKCLGSVGPYLLGMNTGEVGVARQQPAPVEGQVWAHVPCTLGARSSLKRRGRSNYVQTSEGNNHEEEWRQEGGCSLPGAPWLCQEGRKDERRLKVASRVTS